MQLRRIRLKELCSGTEEDRLTSSTQRSYCRYNQLADHPTNMRHRVLDVCTRIILTAFTVLLCASDIIYAETKPASYLLRLAHENLEGNSCVLLQENGTFHYESGDRYSTRVYEGQVPASQLNDLSEVLQKLSMISQKQIEEPLIHGPYDLVDVGFTKDGASRELLFRTAEGQVPYKKSLQPLLQWMDRLHKLPHRQVSEDAGKQNCLPRRRLRLIPREEFVEQPPAPTPKPSFGSRQPTLAPKPAAIPAKVTPILQLGMLTRNSSGARQSCTLVASDGQFHFEARAQSTGSKTVKTQFAKGRLADEDLQTLHSILDAPALAKLRHHEPAGGMALNIMGQVIELYIARGGGVQELILTDSTHRNTFFFAGDGDVSKADALLKFVHQHFETRASPGASSDRNGCTDLQ